MDEVVRLLLTGTACGGITVLAVAEALFFRPVKLGKVRIEGLLRSRWPSLVERTLSEGQKNLLSSEVLSSALGNEDLETEMQQAIDARLQQVIDEVKRQHSFLAMFLSDDLLNSVRNQAKQQLADLLPEMKNKVMARLQASTLLSQLVRDELLRRSWEAVERQASKALMPLLLLGMAVGFVCAAVAAIV